MPLTTSGRVDYCMSINRVRHIVVFVSHYPEARIYTTRCGVTADNVHDDLISRPHRNCEACIPFRKTA